MQQNYEYWEKSITKPYKNVLGTVRIKISISKFEEKYKGSEKSH